jgi:hypothetical protein
MVFLGGFFWWVFYFHPCDKVPPPWLIAMQRYGPPPSYPNLKIPGLNAPIPDGCSFGYHVSENLFFEVPSSFVRKNSILP